MEKIYAKGIYFKTVQASFSNILKASINTNQFKQWLDENTNEKGYCNIDILERKEVGKYGDTHYGVLNTYILKPKEEKAPDLPSAEDLTNGADMPF